MAAWRMPRPRRFRRLGRCLLLVAGARKPCSISWPCMCFCRLHPSRILEVPCLQPVSACNCTERRKREAVTHPETFKIKKKTHQLAPCPIETAVLIPPNRPDTAPCHVTQSICFGPPCPHPSHPTDPAPTSLNPFASEGAAAEGGAAHESGGALDLPQRRERAPVPAALRSRRA